jgi:hypothetical protein
VDNIKVYLKEIWYEDVDWLHLTQETVQQYAVMNMVMNLGFHKRNNLDSCGKDHRQQGKLSSWKQNHQAIINMCMYQYTQFPHNYSSSHQLIFN